MQHSLIDQLANYISKLPGLGPRSARRIVLHLVKERDSLMQPLSELLGVAAEQLVICDSCGNVDDHSPCHICTDPKRDASRICVVEEIADLWAVERSGIFKGKYHVLGGHLSAIDGKGPEELKIPQLVNAASNEAVTEVILATNATVDGQVTAHYIMERLQECGVKISRLAHGIPVGGELDYMDDGTLKMAMESRQQITS